jgi:hypothetical protein
MYPVAFGVFDSETSENWEWFLERLREAIGTPNGLAICTDAGQAIMGAVEKVFPTAEHRECMFIWCITSRNNLEARCLMTIFGQQLIHGQLIFLKSIGGQWMKLDQMQCVS